MGFHRGGMGFHRAFALLTTRAQLVAGASIVIGQGGAINVTYQLFRRNQPQMCSYATHTHTLEGTLYLATEGSDLRAQRREERE